MTNEDASNVLVIANAGAEPLPTNSTIFPLEITIPPLASPELPVNTALGFFIQRRSVMITPYHHADAVEKLTRTP
jgi:hypothetical protein